MNKYLFYISVVLNGILIMYVTGVIPFFLYLSILIILGLLWYIKNLLEKYSALEEDIVLVTEKIEEFSGHLENIYGLEMYYGDDNLESLIEHSKHLINEFVDFQEKYFDIEVDFEPDSEEEAPSQTEE